MQFIRIQLNILHSATNPVPQFSASVEETCCSCQVMDPFFFLDGGIKCSLVKWQNDTIQGVMSEVHGCCEKTRSCFLEVFRHTNAQPAATMLWQRTRSICQLSQMWQDVWRVVSPYAFQHMTIRWACSHLFLLMLLQSHMSYVLVKRFQLFPVLKSKQVFFFIEIC